MGYILVKFHAQVFASFRECSQVQDFKCLILCKTTAGAQYEVPDAGWLLSGLSTYMSMKSAKQGKRIIIKV